MKKHIPNFITLLNLFSGFTAIILASRYKITGSFLMVGFALLFDFCDGLAARLLRVKSELGKQLDSLSDLVSFGVAPAFALYQLTLMTFNQDFNGFRPLPQAEEHLPLQIYGIEIIPFVIYSLYVCAGALRLGKFNLDERQTENFRGMPIPLAAITIISQSFWFLPLTINFLTCLTVTVLMLTNIPLFSLKFKNLRWKENLHRYIFLFLSLALLVIFATFPEMYFIQAIPLITLCYIIISLFYRKRIIS